MKQKMTVGTARTPAAMRTQRLRQMAATRILTRADDDRVALVRVFFTSVCRRGRECPPQRSSGFQPVSDSDNPVTPEIEGQFLIQPFDERRAVLVEEREEADRSFLGVAARKRERARVDELAPQRFVAP